MRTLWISLALAIAAHFAFAAPARAQLAVIDPTNLVQNVLTAARALEQVNNQIRQIEQQTMMLARNPLQLSPEISQSITEARALFDAANGLAFEVSGLTDRIRTLYPETYSAFRLDQVGARSEQWLSEARASLEHAMLVEARAASAIVDMRGRIDRAMSASLGAEGQTSAVQAGNQLLGVNAAQLAEIHVLLAAQGRALTVERMERVAREERAMEIQRRAFPTQRPAPPAPARTAF